MRLNVIHVSRYAPVVPSLWVDTSGVKPVLKAYVNGRYQTLSEEIPAGILTEDMIVNSLDSDAVDMPLSAAQGKILKSLLDEKQDALTPGTGIEITDDNTINVTLDTTVFKVVPSLPDSPASGDENKLHLVPSENTGESNSYKEYLWVNGEWEEIGIYVSTVDLTPYLKKTDAESTYQKIDDSTLATNAKTVVGAINELKSLADTGNNSYMQYLHKVYEEYGAVYNKETGYWELNGLTDLTEEDMWDIYNASLTAFNSFSYDGTTLVGLRYNDIFRTLMDKYPPRFYAASSQYVSAFAAFQGCSNMETLCVGREGSGLQLYGPFASIFNGCAKLRVLKYLNFSSLSTPGDGSEFYACKALKEVRIVKICTDLNFSMSPLIDYKSWKYMIENAKGKSAITVTVHPTTYSYLTGTAQPTAEVGGTTADWKMLVAAAQSKQISFAQISFVQPAETLEVEPLE